LNYKFSKRVRKRKEEEIGIKSDLSGGGGLIREVSVASD